MLSNDYLNFKKSQMLQQFEKGNDVCSIYDLIMDKPVGGSLFV